MLDLRSCKFNRREMQFAVQQVEPTFRTIFWLGVYWMHILLRSFEVASIDKQISHTPGASLMHKNEELRKQMLTVLAEQKKLVQTIHQLKQTQATHKSQLENKVDAEVQEELKKIIENHATTLESLTHRQNNLEGFLANNSAFVASSASTPAIAHAGPTPSPHTSCETPPMPEHGYIAKWTSNKPGGIVEFACDHRYYLQGSIVRTCTGDETWSGDDPSCLENVNASSANMTSQEKCSDPPVPQHGFVQSWNYDKVGGEVTIECDIGYKPVGSTVS